MSDSTPPLQLEGRALVDAVVGYALEKKAEQIALFDVHARSSLSDWVVICQGDNPQHAMAIADAIIRGLKSSHTIAWQQEGLEDGRWIVIDYLDVIVHILLPRLREYYNLEALWDSTTRIDIDESGHAS
jgi:ribosome-associated protein